MKNQKEITHNWPKITGLILIALSALVLIFPKFYNKTPGNDMFSGSFLVSYFFTLGYFAFIIVRHIIFLGWNVFKLDGGTFRLFVVLFTISAFSLNMALGVFAMPVFWLKVYLVLVFLALILYAFREKLPEYFTEPIFFLFGMGLTVAVYFSILLLPVSAFGIMLCWFFGISLHGVVQLIWIPVFLVPVFKTKNRFARISFLTGAVIPLLFVVFFMTKWAKTQDMVENIYENHNPDLPYWVSFSQQIPDDNFTEWAIEGELVNETRTGLWNFDFWGFNPFGPVKRHDPLTVISSTILGPIDIEYNNHVKILETKFKYRHEAIPRLWSGNNLVTKKIKTSVQILPEYRIAYTEKMINIENQNNEYWWTPQEEAIYTFHMPEGAVATSLSLWINGVEQKARLTTKEKADSAYNSIVGYEMRDPSLVTWQEGNQLVVRVFPCTPEEDRVFKLGFTTPLSYNDEKLTFSNVYFEGPDFSGAKEEISIFPGNCEIVEIPGFLKNRGNEYSYDGRYRSKWAITTTAPALSKEWFSFNGKSYHMTEPGIDNVSFNPGSIYLDINNSWSETEFNSVWETVKNKQVYVFYNRVENMTESNKDKLFLDLHSMNFSVFPLYEITDPENSLLITKAGSDSPVLEDFAGFDFHNKIYDWIACLKKPVKAFCLSESITLYIKTLKEFDALDIHYGCTDALTELIEKKQFPVVRTGENGVLIDPSDVVIEMDTVENAGNAPDHIMRLFAYNQILHKAGRNFFNHDYINNDLIALAKEAYVVTPVSSLVVLETTEDYDRFGIEETGSDTSLQNAFLESSGSVPEPHEWALIILSILVITGLLVKKFRI
ncbi:MAG: XrtN system VIT domain-containing protein [Bacteroidota bacterium]